VTVDILLMSWDEAPLLRHSLPAACAQDGARVTVLDNATSDDTREVADEHGVRVERLEPRLPYAAAINEGLRRTDRDAVLLLNADCFLDAGFLAAALPRLGEPGVGSVAPKLIRTTGPRPEDRLGAIDAVGLVVDRRRKNTLVGHGRPELAYDLPGPAFGADGAAALYRRETLEDCELEGQVLDEDIERWASDVDLAWRARVLGWESVYEPGARAWHVRHYSPSTRSSVAAPDRRMQFRNRYLMMLKNDSPAAVLRDLPTLLAYEAGSLGYALVAEPELLGGYRDAARLAPRALRKRRELRRRARGRAGRVPLGLAPAA